MKIAKKILAFIIAAIRKELTMPKHDPSPVSRSRPKPETREDRILKTGLNGFAMLGLITLGVALLVL